MSFYGKTMKLIDVTVKEVIEAVDKLFEHVCVNREIILL